MRWWPRREPSASANPASGSPVSGSPVSGNPAGGATADNVTADSAIGRLRDPGSVWSADGRSDADEGVSHAYEVVARADDIVQQLTAAKLALSLNDVATANTSIDAGLTQARRLLTDLATTAKADSDAAQAGSDRSRRRGDAPARVPGTGSLRPADMPRPRERRRES